MNTQKRNHQFEILMDLVNRSDEAERDGGYDLDEWIDRLNSLDKQSDPFYNIINELDGYRRLLNDAQGNPARIVLVLDMITALCVRHAESLEKDISK